MSQTKKPNRDLHIGVKDMGVFMRVSRATFYKIVNNEPGEYSGKYNYVISLATLKRYPKLFNRYRRTV